MFVAEDPSNVAMTKASVEIREEFPTILKSREPCSRPSCLFRFLRCLDRGAIQVAM